MVPVLSPAVSVAVFNRFLPLPHSCYRLYPTAKQGSFCVTLGETYCFYTNQSGVIRDTLALVRDNLKDKYVTQNSQQNWYQSLFNWSAWLTTLISALAGLLILLLLAFLIGPCILNALTAFVRRQVSQVKLLVLRHQYTPAQECESTIRFRL